MGSFDLYIIAKCIYSMTSAEITIARQYRIQSKYKTRYFLDIGQKNLS